jgi:hypothetical protein
MDNISRVVIYQPPDDAELRLEVGRQQLTYILNAGLARGFYVRALEFDRLLERKYARPVLERCAFWRVLRAMPDGDDRELPNLTRFDFGGDDSIEAFLAHEHVLSFESILALEESGKTR